MPRLPKAAEPPHHDELSPAAAVVPLPAPAPNAWERAVAFLLLFGAAAVPVAVSFRGDDHFRLPKELVLYSVAIVAAAVAAIALVLRRLVVDRGAARALKVPAMLAAGGILWALLSTAFSTQRRLSVDAVVWATSLVIVFLLASFFLRRVRTGLLAAAVFVPALANAAVILLQASGVWNPWVFPPGTEARMMKNALLGNPDYVGVYLVAPALFAAALALASSGARRLAYGAAAMLFAAGVFASATLTALAALLVAGAALVAFWRPGGVRIAAVAVAVVAVAVLAYGPTRARIGAVAAALQMGSFDRALSGRVVPFTAAAQMFADRPLLGMGPGTFKYHYLDYRVALRQTRPRLFAQAGEVANFGEVHNDHLQVLAEAGLPGYALLLAGMIFVARRSRLRGGTDARRRTASIFAAPLVILLAVVMLAQFALALAASAFTYALLGGACVAWTDDDVA